MASIAALASLPLIMSAASTDDIRMPGSDRDSHGCIGSAGYIWSDATQKCVRPWEENPSATGSVRPPKALSGAEIDMQSLHMAISKLSETDRMELTKTIKTYLDSKGIKIPTKDETEAIKKENKVDRQEVKKENTATRETARTTTKSNHEAMKKRIDERRNNVMKGSISQ